MNIITGAPVRDQLISMAEGVVGEAWEELDGWCNDCAGSLTGWCDRCGELLARVDEVAPVLSRLYAAGTDKEARKVAAGLPALARAVA